MGCINSKSDDPTSSATNPAAHRGAAAATTAAANEATAASPQVIQNVQNEVTGTDFSEQYTLGKMIGSGTFSVVREAVHKKTNQKYAIKCIKRDGLTPEDIEALTAEVAILKQMKHPNIMILHDFYTEDKYYYLVTEYMEGGELFDRIVEKSYYTEREARDLVKLLLEAIKYCHDKNVVHRDLKPENLLLTSKADNASIKLADFGFAKKIDISSDGLSTACGTPGYVAPEILQGKTYGRDVDIWSIGVITYILLCGYPPFHDDNHNALFRKIKRGKFQYDAPYWDHVSSDAKELINMMLVVDPAERSSASDLLKHKWIIGTDVANVQLTSALEELKRYNARRRLKAAVNTVTAANRMNKALTAGSVGDAGATDVVAAAAAKLAAEAETVKDGNADDEDGSKAAAIGAAAGLTGALGAASSMLSEKTADLPGPVKDAASKATGAASKLTEAAKEKAADAPAPVKAVVDKAADSLGSVTKAAGDDAVKTDVTEAVGDDVSATTKSIDAEAVVPPAAPTDKITSAVSSSVAKVSGLVTEKTENLPDPVKGAVAKATAAASGMSGAIAEKAGAAAVKAVDVAKEKSANAPAPVKAAVDKAATAVNAAVGDMNPAKDAETSKLTEDVKENTTDALGSATDVTEAVGDDVAATRGIEAEAVVPPAAPTDKITSAVSSSVAKVSGLVTEKTENLPDPVKGAVAKATAAASGMSGTIAEKAGAAAVKAVDVAKEKSASAPAPVKAAVDKAATAVNAAVSDMNPVKDAEGSGEFFKSYKEC